nr:hypothetical protein [Tanacetum cinerariifolium]
MHKHRLHSDNTSFLEGLDHQGFFSRRNTKAYMFVLRRRGLSVMCAASIRSSCNLCAKIAKWMVFLFEVRMKSKMEKLDHKM